LLHLAGIAGFFSELIWHSKNISKSDICLGAEMLSCGAPGDQIKVLQPVAKDRVPVTNLASTNSSDLFWNFMIID
jgi:hypothetical protein